jgi:hypothetical protein
MVTKKKKNTVKNVNGNLLVIGMENDGELVIGKNKKINSPTANKIYFPDVKITKGMRIDYYQSK